MLAAYIQGYLIDFLNKKLGLKTTVLVFVAFNILHNIFCCLFAALIPSSNSLILQYLTYLFLLNLNIITYNASILSGVLFFDAQILGQINGHISVISGVSSLLILLIFTYTSMSSTTMLLIQAGCSGLTLGHWYRIYVFEEI